MRQFLARRRVSSMDFDMNIHALLHTIVHRLTPCTRASTSDTCHRSLNSCIAVHKAFAPMLYQTRRRSKRVTSICFISRLKVLTFKFPAYILINKKTYLTLSMRLGHISNTTEELDTSKEMKSRRPNEFPVNFACADFIVNENLPGRWKLRYRCIWEGQIRSYPFHDISIIINAECFNYDGIMFDKAAELLHYDWVHLIE